MNEQQIQMVMNYLDQLGERLGVGVGQVWPWFVRQQYVEAIWALSCFIILSIVCYFVLSFTLKHWDPRDEDGYPLKGVYNIEREDHDPLWAILCCISGFACLISALHFMLEVPDLFNVNYAALKDIISSVK